MPVPLLLVVIEMLLEVELQLEVLLEEFEE